MYGLAINRGLTQIIILGRSVKPHFNRRKVPHPFTSNRKKNQLEIIYNFSFE
jgi:hypothetical protein